MSKKDKYLVAAQRFAERGQLDKALAELGKVVQEDPKDTRTWLKMAELHAKRGASAEAAEIYARTGDLYTEQGFTQKAVAVYKNVLKLSPSTVSAHQKLGMIFKQLGLLSDAVQQFELAAVGFQQAGQFPEAVAALRLAAELQPDNVVLRVNLAESASQAGLTDEAVREFGVAADALEAAGRTEEYIRVSERLLFHRPDDVQRTRALAETYVSRGNARLALPKLQTCLRMDVRDPATLSLLARALEQLGQKAKAVSVVKELVRLFAELGREPEREAAILRGLTLDPTDPELRALGTQAHLRGVQQPTPSPVWRGTPSPDIGPAASVPIPMGASGRVLSALEGLGEGPGAGPRELGPSGGPPAVTISSPEITRILAESEVFVKYELLDRAASNLRRVFELDPLHREARQKLIEVLVELGRHRDAALESVILAEQLASEDPAAARRHAGRAVGLDPSHGAGNHLVRQLAVGGGAAGAGAEMEVPAESAKPLPARFQPSRMMFLDDRELEDPRAWKLDDDEPGADPNADLLTPPVVDVSAASRARARAALDVDARTQNVGVDVDMDMDMDMDVEVDLDLDPTLASRTLGLTMGDIPAAHPASNPSGDAGQGGPRTTFDVEDEAVAGAARRFEIDDGPSSEGSLDAGDVAFELDIGTSDLLAVELVESEVKATPPPDGRRATAPAEGPRPVLALPGLVAPLHSAAREQLERSELDVPREPESVDDDPTTAIGRRSPLAGLEAALSERVEADVETVEMLRDRQSQGRRTGLQAASGGDATEATDDAELDGELEQVSFFIEQGLFDDARGLIDELGARFSGSRRSAARLVKVEQQLEAALQPALGAKTDDRDHDHDRGRDAADDDDVATTVIRTEEPSDPGESYLRLGLFDAAVEEYKKLARNPAREVFALTRMGDSFQGKGSFTEAILRYKRGLNCDNVTREEARLLYFQLGMTFERLGDISEALYFFEKVAKRDPDFREAARKVAELLPRKVKRA